MNTQTHAKQERIVEAVRHGLEGVGAVEFLRQSGYAMTISGLARHLRAMGGRGRVQELVNIGKSNVEILETCFPETDFSQLEREPEQAELFVDALSHQESHPFPGSDTPLYDTVKLSFRAPADLYEALRLAARAEGKTQNQLITEILTSALSRMPVSVKAES
ncbi:MAG: hypothetical protein HY706_08855 [Candidatus Hydrogenedentes bacterium]|nr:hypothetical protein [Candidatus Hydrogenedentota bacterium]